MDKATAEDSGPRLQARLPRLDNFRGSSQYKPTSTGFLRGRSPVLGPNTREVAWAATRQTKMQRNNPPQHSSFFFLFSHPPSSDHTLQQSDLKHQLPMAPPLYPYQSTACNFSPLRRPTERIWQ